MYSELVEFIRALYPNHQQIPLHEPRFRGNERSYVNDCLETTFVSSVGEYTHRVEDKLCQLTGSHYATVVVNGTSALHTALTLLGIQRGDDVITQSLTFVATANAIKYCQANPIFIDCNRDHLSLCPQKLRDFLVDSTYIDKEGVRRNQTGHNRVKACIVMHTLGHPAQIDEIQQVCTEFDIELVEDAAESLGSLYKNRHTGTFAPIGILSFNGNKVATAGGGGALLIQDKSVAKLARHLTTTAKVPHQWEFVHDRVAFNYRMPNINAALLLGQLEGLEALLLNKRSVASKYETFFKEREMRFIKGPADTLSNYWINAIELSSFEEREACLSELNENNIHARGLWTPMHMLDMYSNCQRGPMENTEALYKTIVCLPSSSTNQE